LDVACAGMDQRKAHMLARDVAGKLGWRKPICIHTPLLMGLQGPKESGEQYDENVLLSLRISSKMSKSKPESCIFMHDSPEAIKQKIKNAFCPPKQSEGNPVLEHAKYIIFPEKGVLEIPRPEKYGGSLVYESYEKLEEDYVNGKVHPLDLKNGVAEALIEVLEPVREYFKRHPDNLEKMKKIEITR